MKEQTPLSAFNKGIQQQPAFSWMGRCLSILLGLGILTGSTITAQTFTPIPVTGFTQDVIAETGTSTLAVTSVRLDGANATNANFILYSKAFAIANNIAPVSGTTGGVPDNGTIVNGTRTYQLQPFSAYNALVVSEVSTVPFPATSGTLTLVTPAVLSKVSVLLFSTEGYTYVTAKLNYTDGTSTTTASTMISDWFNGTPITIYQGLGRIHRDATGSYSPGGLPGAPIFAGWDISVPCASLGKSIQSITFTSTSGSFGSEHRAAIFGISGAAYVPDVVAPTTVIPPHCGTNSGLITVAATGNSPFTYSWNTTPVQTGAVASNLAPNTYTVTATNASGCTTTYTTTITAIPASTLTATASQPTICTGNNTTLTVSSNSSTPTTYTWTPGGQTGTSVTVSPSSTTTYTVTGSDYYGCSPNTTVPVTVKAGPTAKFTVTPDPSCVNSPQTVTFTGTAPGTATYDWASFAGATVKSGSGAGPYSIQFSQPGTYSVQLNVSDNGCTSSFTKPVNIIGVAVAPVVSIKATTTTSVTFGWPAVTGATGYQVSVNGGAYIDPSSGAYGLTHTINGLSQDQSVSISVIALSPTPCQAGPAGTATGKTLHDPIFVPNSFSPNGDGRNDVFKVYSNLAASMDLKIFNQWGELLFATSNLADGWDGKFKGKAQPSGVYIYAVRVKLIDGTEVVRKGAVNLLH